jgi:hypothetical protein
MTRKGKKSAKQGKAAKATRSVQTNTKLSGVGVSKGIAAKKAMQQGQQPIIDDVADTLGANPVLYRPGGRGPTNYRGIDQVWRSLGRTDDGRRWALSALHPCDEELTPPSGIPDFSATTVVTPSFRNTSTISKIVEGTGNWDVQIIMPPNPEVDYLYRQKLSSDAGWGAWQLVRPSVFSANPDGTAQTLQTIGYRRYRYQGRGYTVHHIASGLTNEGTAFAGQVQATQVRQITPEFAGEPTTTETAGVFATTLKPPSFPQDLVQEDSLCVQWPAKHGVYMPMRFVDTVHIFQEAAGDGRLTDGTTVSPESFGSIISATTPGGVAGTNNIVAIPAPTFTTPPTLPNATQLYYGASTPGNLLTGVMFFMGLNTVASLEVKSRMHLENQVSRDGFAVQSFVHSPPVYDADALEVVAKVSQVQKHAYYASYNDLGSILGSIWGAIKSVGKPIAQLVEDSGIPILSSIGHVAGRLIRGVEAGVA